MTSGVLAKPLRTSQALRLSREAEVVRGAQTK